VAEKLRAAVENLPFSVNNGSITLRVSIGVGEMQERHKTPDDVFRVAESALRNAKEKGRNCVSVFRDATGAPIAAPPPV
jgi:diguanylate cyclase (GGDEF)-like protein